MRRTDFFWMVGLLEGEGCFLINTAKSKPGYRYPRVVLHMTDRDIVIRFCKLTGGTFNTPKRAKGNRKQAFIGTISGKKGVMLMRKIKPYMGTRRRQQITHVLQKSSL